MYDIKASNEEYIRQDRLKNYSAWFLIAFAVGLILRLVLLNTMVYTQNELVLVNQALQISRRMSADTSMVPVYTGLTGWLFFLFGSGNFLARLLPAIVGASVTLVAWAWRERLGQKTALILSFALAFEPTYLLFSRAIHGGIFAIAGLLWAFTFLKKNKPLLAGVSLAIALMSGSSFWYLILFIGLTCLIMRIVKPDSANDLFSFQLRSGKRAWISLAAGFVVSSVLILTSFLLDPSGLGGVASGIIGFAGNFAQPFEKPIYHSIYLLIAHSLLPFLAFFLGFLAFRTTKQSNSYRIGAVSILISLIIGALISRDSYEFLLWPVLVSWIGGAIWLGKLKVSLKESWFSTAILMGFVLAILIYLLVNIGRLAGLPFGTPQFWSIFLMIIAGVILLVSSWWLVKFGWSEGNGNQIFLVTLLFLLAILTMGDSTRSLHSAQQFRSIEYLDNQLVLPNNDIDSILADFDLTRKPLQQSGDFSLIDLPEEFSWYFREFSIERNDPETSVILARTSVMPDQNVEFRGINVVLERTIDWKKDSLTTYLQALIGKPTQFENQKGVLWVRTNLFTGASQ